MQCHSALLDSLECTPSLKPGQHINTSTLSKLAKLDLPWQHSPLHSLTCLLPVTVQTHARSFLMSKRQPRDLPCFLAPASPVASSSIVGPFPAVSVTGLEATETSKDPTCRSCAGNLFVPSFPNIHSNKACYYYSSFPFLYLTSLGLDQQNCGSSIRVQGQHSLHVPSG